MNQDPDSPDSSKANSFEGFRPPRPPDPPLPPTAAAANENETTREKPKKKKKRIKEIQVMGDPIGPSTMLWIGDPTTQSAAAAGSSSKPMKKADAPKITRPCTECGKKFWSWKALFGHMRCHPERDWRGINRPELNPPKKHGSSSSADCHKKHGSSSSADPQGLGFGGVVGEDQEVATSLLMLANGLLSMDPTQFLGYDHQGGSPEPVDSSVQSGTFECSSCKRVFGSHQALGGHRASHKNVKGCFAIDDRNNNEGESSGNVRGKSKGPREEKMKMVLGHSCGICNKVFSSGQALGGHMRCHWERGDQNSSSSSLMLQQQGQGQGQGQGGLVFNPAAASGSTRGGRDDDGGYVLDLNWPPPYEPDEPEPEPEPEPDQPAPAPAPVDDDDEDSSSSSTSSSAIDLNLKLGF